MKKIVCHTILLISIIVPFETTAQAPGNSKSWNIEDCFRYATEHNIQISTFRLNELSAIQDLTAAKGVKIPGLSGSVSNTFNNANNSSGTGGLVNQLSSGGSYSLNSSILLWNYNYVNNNIRQKQLLIQSAGLAVQQSMNNITLLITKSYLDILLAKENLKYVDDLVTTSAERVKQGQMFYDAGRIAKKDLLQMQAQLASDKYLQVQVQNSIQQNILTLKQDLQLPADSSFEITTPEIVTVMPVIQPLNDVQQVAQNNFPEIRMGKLALDIANLSIAKAKADFKPSLTASGSLGSGYSTVITNPVYPKTNIFTQAGNNFYQRAGITLSIPIFANRVNTANLEKARIAYRQANLNLQNDQLVLSQAVERAYLDAMNAMQSYDAANVQLQYTTESYRISNEQFKLGAINTYDLLQQRNQYVQAVQEYTQAKYSALLYQKIYEFYMGKRIIL